jgi:aspartyl protease family protein
MRILLTLVIAAGVALGLLWPWHDNARPAVPADQEVVLHRSSDRHFYADADVDGKSIRFLVDTGASAIALTEQDAQKLGLNPDRQQYELIGQGASGLVRGKFVKLLEIQVGDIRQQDATVAIVEGSTVSLLGQPFLEQLDEIVIRKDTMLLRAGPGRP